MPGLTIDNEQLAEKLRKLAAQENLSVEDLLSDLVEHRESGSSEELPASHASVESLRKLAYARARSYWRAVGDKAKASLTDEQLQEQLAGFDENDVPRLHTENMIAASLSRLALLARQSSLALDDEAVSSRSDDILQDEFADYLIKRMNGQTPDAAS